VLKTAYAGSARHRRRSGTGFPSVAGESNLEIKGIEGSPFEDVGIWTALDDRVTPDELDQIVAEITGVAKPKFPRPPGDVSEAMFAWIIHVAGWLPMEPYPLSAEAKDFGCDDGTSVVSLGGGAVRGDSAARGRPVFRRADRHPVGAAATG